MSTSGTSTRVSHAMDDQDLNVRFESPIHDSKEDSEEDPEEDSEEDLEKDPNDEED